MVYNLNTLKLSIPSKIVEYKYFIEHCCDFILDLENFGNDFNRIAKFKLVIMELLTNAIKHSKTESFLEISKMDHSLIVRKIDSGQKFNCKNSETNQDLQIPIKDFTAEFIINVRLGNNYELPILIKGENHIEFLEPENLNHDSFFNIPENFGLLIIKQCSDNFSYYYDNKKNVNVFEVIFNL